VYITVGRLINFKEYNDNRRMEAVCSLNSAFDGAVGRDEDTVCSKVVQLGRVLHHPVGLWSGRARSVTSSLSYNARAHHF
jgi:hypothetical protein